MSSWRIGLRRSSTIVLVAATILCLHPRPIAAQDLQAKPASTDRPDAAPCSLLDEKSKPASQDVTGDSLPDAPLPAGQAQEQAQDSAATSVQTAVQQANQLSVLPPTLTRTPLTGQDKFLLYIHKSFGPPAVILPAFGAGFQMLNPPNHYPREWKDGADAFGRNYGYRVADRTSRETAQFLTGFLLHEDPRYQRSTSTNAFRRTFHALAFTVVDKTDSGRNTLAISNFAAAAAGGLVGMGILPNGYNDITHAGQHMASEFLQIAIGNVAAEFEPEWGPWVEKIHLPKILPAWWVPQHSHQP
ncbi:MAG TPA: hypothetical protein VK788_21695 [Terriglobales bacterium]|jgi:hypothetical protein|nr:hypothetical protein [Terriglobales bacterium]